MGSRDDQRVLDVRALACEVRGLLPEVRVDASLALVDVKSRQVADAHGMAHSPWRFVLAALFLFGASPRATLSPPGTNPRVREPSSQRQIDRDLLPGGINCPGVVARRLRDTPAGSSHIVKRLPGVNSSN